MAVASRGGSASSVTYKHLQSRSQQGSLCAAGVPGSGSSSRAQDPTQLRGSVSSEPTATTPPGPTAPCLGSLLFISSPRPACTGCQIVAAEGSPLPCSKTRLGSLLPGNKVHTFKRHS